MKAAFYAATSDKKDDQNEENEENP